MRPRLSIVVFSRDDADHLGRCLASLVTVEPEGGREVLVVDNASTDASLEVVEAASGDLPVSCIALEEETSFSRGNNLGLEEARGEQVLFLNPDTLPTQATIEACQRALDDDPGVGLVSPRLVYPDGSHQATGWHLPSPTQLLRERLGVSSREVPPSGSGSTDVGWLMGCLCTT